MIGLLTVLCLILWAYIIAKRSPSIYAEKLAAFTVCGFFFLYTIVSAGFFWADCFSFEGALTVCLLLEAVLAAAYTAREIKVTGVSGVKALLPQITFFDPRYRLLLLIVLAALPFTWNKFELYSMGQDQGTYQVKALALMEYDTHNYMEMTEFTKLETPKERQKYLDFIYGQNNLYLPRVIEETKTDASEFTNIVGTIHGLPTYSALLALWGKLFGYEKMIGVQTVLYLALLGMVYFVCENLKLKRASAFFVTLMTAASPILLWLSKSSLTEIGITLIVSTFLYFLTGKEPEWMCMIPVIVFAFFHISLYAFMPIFLIVLAVMYVIRRKRGYLAAIAGSTIGYTLGAIWAFDIAPYYSYGNYSELGRITGGLLGEKVLIPLIVGICILVLVLCFVLGSKRVSQRVFAFWDALADQRKCMVRPCYLLLRSFLILSVLFFVYKGVVQGETTTACEYLQISTYIYMSGILLIPLIYLALFFKPEKLFQNEIYTSLVLLFLYCVVMYSMVMRVRILFYYYFARYAALFLPVIFLLGALLLEQMKKKWAVLLAALAFLSFVPYDKGLLVQKDHSRCEWEFLGDVCEYIGENDAFVVGPDEQQIVFIFPVKLLTGCDVYYADEQLSEQLSGLAQKYEHVYYMDYDTVFEDEYEDSLMQQGMQVNKVYTNWNHLSYLDYFNITNPLTPIPLNYVEYRLKLSMHEIRAD